MISSVELREFFVCGTYSETQHSLLHISEPESPEEKDKGYFFAIAEIRESTKKEIEKIQELINEIEILYYKSDVGSHRENFEKILQKINEDEKFEKLKKSNMDLFVAVMRGHSISFAHRGTPNVLLFHNSHNSLHRKKLIEKDLEQNSDKIFSTVVEGKVHSKNYFYISTPNVSEVFSNDRIQKLLTSRTVEQTIKHIQKVLESMSDGSSYGGIICKVLNSENQIEDEHKKTGSIESIEQMIDHEKNTQETLSPSFFSNSINELKKIFSPPHFKQDDENINSPKARHQNQNTSTINMVLVTTGKALVITFLAIFRIIKFIALFTYRLFSTIFFLITKPSKRNETKEKWRKYINHKKHYFKTMSILHKILLTLLIILTATFIGSIVFMRVQTQQELERQIYVGQIQEIINKQIEAESSIIYKDEKTAFNLLKEAEEIINNLPSENKIQEQKKEELIADLDVIFRKLRKIEIVKADIFAELPDARINKLEFIDNILIAYNKDIKTLYKINLGTKQIETQEYNETFDFTQSTVPKENDKILFLDDNNSIIEYDRKTSSIISQDISYQKDNPNISNIFIYNQRLYSIDINSSEIYKHNETQTGYDKGALWLKQDVDLSDAVDLAIDSSLYVLKLNGELLKFSSGVQEEFSINMIDPAMEEPTQMWTYSDVDEIFILEPKQKRIVIIDKGGVLLKQYTSLDWQNPTSMSVDIDNKKLYVIDSGKVYKINL
ncbi:MAG: hypothetical protein L3J07_02765 [Candidatus Magasanikbacteria bacterium]|nr:hypothetical protein [Candidatus Magasanikbacteria bacterium]